MGAKSKTWNARYFKIESLVMVCGWWCCWWPDGHALWVHRPLADTVKDDTHCTVTFSRRQQMDQRRLETCVQLNCRRIPKLSHVWRIRSLKMSSSCSFHYRIKGPQASSVLLNMWNLAVYNLWKCSLVSAEYILPLVGRGLTELAITANDTVCLNSKEGYPREGRGQAQATA